MNVVKHPVKLYAKDMKIINSVIEMMRAQLPLNTPMFNFKINLIDNGKNQTPLPSTGTGEGKCQNDQQMYWPRGERNSYALK